MATKAEIVAELKTYPAYNDIKETVLMRELKASLEKRLADVKNLPIEEVKNVKESTKKVSRTKKSTAKVDFGDNDLDMDLLNDDSIVNDFYDDDFEEVDDDFPF